MALITKTRHLASLLIYLLFFNIIWSQNTIYKVSLKQQLDVSSQILEGEVLSKTSFWDNAHKYIYTAYKVKAFKVFKGELNDIIEIIVKGGVVGNDAQVVSHSLQMKKGDLGIFMLSGFQNNDITRSNEIPKFKSVSDAQGYFKYSVDDNKVANTFLTRNDINNFYKEISELTNKNYHEIEPLNIEKRKTISSFNRSSGSMAPEISSFSANKNSAGTHSVLTISGSGFGTTKGSVGFSNANYGGALHTNALDNQVLSWSDDQIQVEIPDIAGTGTIKVNTVSNGSIVSNTILNIDYAQINMSYDIGSGDEDFQTQHVDLNGEGGLTFTINQDFSGSDAMRPFQEAMNSWSCESGMNWKVGATTPSTTLDPYDGVNLVTLGSLSLGTLGNTFSAYSACFQDGEIKWYVTDVDMIFNSNISWNFNTGNPAPGERDFESVAVHELGHALQLGHVIDTNVVMHYSLSSGEVIRDLSAKDIMGSTDIQFRNTNQAICGENLTTDRICSATALSTNDFDITNSIMLYPNPSSGQFFIKNNGQAKINKLQVYNIMGKLIYSTHKINSNLMTIDLNDHAKGLYLLTLETDYGSTTKKLIIQ